MAVDKVKNKRKMNKKPNLIEDSVLKEIAAINSKHSTQNKIRKSNYNKGKNKKVTSNKEAKQDKDSESDSEEVKSQLMLKDVLDLGGTKDDYDLLKDVKEEVEYEGEVIEDDNFDISELIKFMKANDMKIPKKEKKNNQEMNKTDISVDICDSLPPNCILKTEKLLFKANELWYSNVVSHKTTRLHQHTDKWKQYATKLWEREVTNSEQWRSKHKSNDQSWMKTVLSGGTINDKISAHCLLLQESPVHHIRSLEALLAMAKKKSKRLSVMAVETLKEMFLSTILPSQRKLLNFSQHDFNELEKSSNSDGLVLGWIVEDSLKNLFGEFLESVKVHLKDNEVAIRTKMCNLCFQLLNEIPEREQDLLSMIVNKIGDPDNKLASKIIFILTQLLRNHPNMKKVVALEIERILYRTNISERAQYYAVCFLNQLKLSPEDKELAGHLIKIYFKFFKELVDNKNIDSRMLGALLTGVNRSYPYTENSDAITTENINTLFKLVYVSNFNVAVQALMLLFQVTGSNDSITDRYYQALYAKLIDPGISSSSKKTFLMNLIYKSLKRDSVVPRKLAIARRLLQISNLDDPVLACASLYAVAAANKDSVESKETVKASKSSELDSTSESKEVEPHEVRNAIYSVSTRNPLYASADKLAMWEFNLLNKNYHPSVNQFVVDILDMGNVSYSGDPFADFTQMKFLDKFVFKNPKKNVRALGKKFYTKDKTTSVQVYSSDFSQKKVEDIDAADVFFYDYFKNKVPPKDKSETSDLDFADEIKTVSLDKMEKKKKTDDNLDDAHSNEENGESGDESGSDYSYGDIDEDHDDLDKNKDSVYERVLWENLNSDGESFDEDDEESGTQQLPGEAESGSDEEEWEDLELADDSDNENSKQPNFVDADSINDIIMEHKNKNISKKKRKSSPYDDFLGSPKKKTTAKRRKK